MANRYVWEKKSISTKESSSTQSKYIMKGRNYYGANHTTSRIIVPDEVKANYQNYSVKYGSGYTRTANGFSITSGTGTGSKTLYPGLDASDGTFSSFGPGYTGSYSTTAQYGYFIIYNHNSYTYANAVSDTCYKVGNLNQLGYGGSGYLGFFYPSTGALMLGFLSYTYGGNEDDEFYDTADNADLITLSLVNSYTLIGNVSSSSSSAYPTDGAYNSYYYVYKGTDCIDPTAVGYSTTTPKGGEAITIKATARSNTYGGTISYKYQYSTNGGSTWTDIATTTATSQSVTIPKGSTQFKARVLASDNYGFTSTTYVEGANLTVKNDSVYAGVSGTVKAVSAVVCVGGAIKTNVSMYQGVNGTVKQS